MLLGNIFTVLFKVCAYKIAWTLTVNVVLRMFFWLYYDAVVYFLLL